jgi:hypothetical protein
MCVCVSMCVCMLADEQEQISDGRAGSAPSLGLPARHYTRSTQTAMHKYVSITVLLPPKVRAITSRSTETPMIAV